MKYIFSGISRIPAPSKVELFVSLVNNFQLWTNVLKNYILGTKINFCDRLTDFFH